MTFFPNLLIKSRFLGWTPKDLTGIGAWFDANRKSGISISSKSFVDGWVDASGNGRDASISSPGDNQFSSGHRHNGLNKITSRGSGGGAHLNASYTPSGSDIFVCAKVRRGRVPNANSGSSLRPFIGFGDNSFSVGTAFTNDAAGFVVRTWDGATIHDSSSGSFPFGKMATIIAQFRSGTSMQVWLDGVLVIDEAAASPTIGSLTIGHQVGATNRYWPGDLCEVVVGEGVLSSGDRDNLNTYMQRWDSGRAASVVYDWTSPTTLISDCGAGQGAIAGGNSFFATEGDTPGETIRVYDDTLTFDNAYDASSDNGGSHTQVNGMWYDNANDKLYVGANTHPAQPASGWIYEYDFDTLTRTLSFVAAHSVGDNDTEGCYGLSDGSFMVVFHDTNVIRLYDSSWVLQDTLRLSPAYDGEITNLFQSITMVPDAAGDVVYMGTHGSNSDRPWYVAYLYKDGKMYEANTLIPRPTASCAQSIAYEDSTFLFAERTGNFNGSLNNMVRATPVSSVIDVG